MKYSTEIRYEKTFPGDYKNLAEIGEFIRKAGERGGFGEIEVYELQLAVDEAFTNIIEHAYGGEGEGEIECVCLDSDGDMTIVLHDWGEAFDPGGVPEPDFSVPIEELNSRGAGLVLIRKIMDKTEYRFSKEGNFLIMTKHK
ncbi:MAG: ATP-binding protein [Chloroflexi bacterium]|nr:ATP-binding protein [Chloroflexota bacterium]